MRGGTPEEALEICGIYSDITNGGKTAKSAQSLGDGPLLWQLIPVALKDSHRSEALVRDWGALFPSARLVSVEAYIAQTFGPTIGGIRRAALGTAAAVMLISFVITLLSLWVLVGKDRRDIALLRSAGFSARAVLGQYMVRIIILLIPSLFLGIAFSLSLGESLSSGLLSFFGAVSFSFVPSSPLLLILTPVLIALPASLATLLLGPVLGSAEILSAVRS